MTDSAVHQKVLPSRAEVEQVVISALARTLRLPEEDVRPDSGLENDLGLDSMGAINVNIALEEQFHIVLPACEGPEDVLTVRDLVNLVVRKLESQPAEEASKC
jgi:acyl carrier protein